MALFLCPLPLYAWIGLHNKQLALVVRGETYAVYLQNYVLFYTEYVLTRRRHLIQPLFRVSFFNASVAYTIILQTIFFMWKLFTSFFRHISYVSDAFRRTQFAPTVISCRQLFYFMLYWKWKILMYKTFKRKKWKI